MRAAVFKAPGEKLAIETVADPRPGPDDIVLQVKACGICGSDLHMSEVCDAAGGMKPLPKGAVMGHEFCGEIVELGANARAGWKIGQRVTALPFIGCGFCLACLSGQGHRCASTQYLGMGGAGGGYADYVRVGALETLALPDGVSWEAGAMVEPLAVGLHAVEAARLRPGDAVLVVGAGPVGLAVALWCRHLGARHVIVSDLAPERLALAARCGATDGIDARGENVVDRFKRLAGARPDVVFDCVGVPGSQQLAMDYAPTGGRIVVAGVCMQPDRIVPVKAITKELTVSYVYMYGRKDFALAIEMLDRGRLDPSAMLTGQVGFAQFPTAFDALRTDKSQCKVMLRP
ncbi:MAG: alcohol dehydrogenase catalytic domain-containing protein [Reyranellaceae bacterium]